MRTRATVEALTAEKAPTEDRQVGNLFPGYEKYASTSNTTH